MHPKMETNIFIDNKLGALMNKLSKENKKNIYIAGNFNFDLLKFPQHEDTANFFNKMTSNLFIPHNFPNMKIPLTSLTR